MSKMNSPKKDQEGTKKAQKRPKKTPQTSSSEYHEEMEELLEANKTDDISEFWQKSMKRIFELTAHDLGWVKISDEEKARIAKARTNINDFIEYCFTDERGVYVTQQPFHREWQKLADEQRNLVLWAPVEHGKTKQLTIFRTLWILGNDPNATIALISETSKGKAYKYLQEIKEHIRGNVRLQRVFPKLRKGKYWRQSEIEVEREIITKDPSVQATGIEGPINGARLSHAILDDVCSFSNTYSAGRRERVLEWIEQEVLSRMMKGPRFIATGSAWHRDDFMHAMSRRENYSCHRYTAIDCTISELRENRAGIEDKILWPANWTVQRLQDRLSDVGTTAFGRQMLNAVHDDASAMFRTEWIERALLIGRGQSLEPTYQPKKDERIVVGLDLAMGDNVKTHDLNTISVLLFDGHRYRLLWVESDYAGRWSPHDHIERIRDINDRYHGPEFRIESNLGQKYMHFFTKASIPNARLVATQTGIEKRHPTLGVQAIGIWLERGMFALPNAVDGKIDYEVKALCEEMLCWLPQDRHIPDRLASLYFAFAGHEKARMPKNWKPSQNRQTKRGAKGRIGYRTEF